MHNREMDTMNEQELQLLLESLRAGAIDTATVFSRLKDLPFNDLGYAKVDHHRTLRTGYPEVIFCQGKQVEHVLGIVGEQINHDETVLGTRASTEVIAAVEKAFPAVSVNRTGRCFWKKSSTWQEKDSGCGTIAVATAGTADVPVAEEARCTLEVLGHRCTALHDVGVSGIHRLLSHRDMLEAASALVVIAGMEGALPSVVAGMVSVPVIAVPTSVGYGAHLGGLVPLFAMLNSCASGLTVVNIDNGFGAAFAAATIADQRIRSAKQVVGSRLTKT